MRPLNGGAPRLVPCRPGGLQSGFCATSGGDSPGRGKHMSNMFLAISSKFPEYTDGEAPDAGWMAPVRDAIRAPVLIRDARRCPGPLFDPPRVERAPDRTASDPDTPWGHGCFPRPDDKGRSDRAPPNAGHRRDPHDGRGAGVRVHEEFLFSLAPIYLQESRHCWRPGSRRESGWSGQWCSHTYRQTFC